MTARREFGGAILLCIVGAGLVLLALRQGWARVDYTAPQPLPSGSVSVSGQDLLPAASALALAALACLAAIIATRGLARRAAGLAMAGLGGWVAVVVSAPVHAAGVIAAASGSAASGGFAGSLSGGNSATSGSSATGGGLPAIGTATKVALAGVPWRSAAVAGAAVVIAAGLIAAWRGPRWPVMSARFDRPGQQVGAGIPTAGGAAVSGTTMAGAAGGGAAAGDAAGAGTGSAQAPGSGSAAGTGGAAGQGSAEPPEPEPAPAWPGPGGALHPDEDTAALWEALDRGVDLTDTPDLNAGPEPVAAPARGDEH